jgi:hypothetical protein
MRELGEWYRSLPTLARVAIAGALLVAAIVVVANVPSILSALLVVGLVLLAIGVVLTVVGICSLPFVGFGLAVYGLVKALGSISPPRRTPAPVVDDRRSGSAGANQVQLGPTAELPAEIAAGVARLQGKAAALRSPGQEVFLTMEDQQHLDRTLNEYVPNCLATYQGLPSDSSSWPAGPEGETASQLVERQLRLLEESLDEIRQRVFEAGAAQLVAQQRFLEERFRPRVPADLDL